MKTEVVMHRDLFNREVRQLSKSGFFSATDLVTAGNAWRLNNDMVLFRLNNYFENKDTQEFIQALKDEFKQEPIMVTRGRNSTTWVHPLLFIDIALSISPKLKIEVYKWLYDELIKFRNSSGDSFKKMAGALFERHGNKATFGKAMVQLSLQIQEACKLQSPDWQHATEDQLKLRDKIQDNIALLASVMNNNAQAIRLGILRATQDII